MGSGLLDLLWEQKQARDHVMQVVAVSPEAGVITIDLEYEP
jgi:hypothetical protein